MGMGEGRCLVAGRVSACATLPGVVNSSRVWPHYTVSGPDVISRPWIAATHGALRPVISLVWFHVKQCPEAWVAQLRCMRPENVRHRGASGRRYFLPPQVVWRGMLRPGFCSHGLCGLAERRSGAAIPARKARHQPFFRQARGGSGGPFVASSCCPATAWRGVAWLLLASAAARITSEQSRSIRARF